MKSKKLKKSFMPRPVQVERITVGNMILSSWNDGKFWLSRSGGESMETSEKKLVEILRKFWEKEF